MMKAWEPEEEQIIMEMLERLGPKWSKIVQRLPGRTVSSVRNRWQRIDKGRRLREAGHESKNRCQQCGKPKRGHVCMARLKNRGESGELAEGDRTRLDCVFATTPMADSAPLGCYRCWSGSG